jgi:DNA repair protein RecO (recombination protein O)
VVRSIILNKHSWGEADELVVFMARDLGWLSGVAKNARKSRVRFGGHLEPFTLVDLTLRPRRRDDLVWIDDAQVVRGFMKVRSDLPRACWCAYFLELASVFLPEGTPDEELFDFLVHFLEDLDESDPVPLLVMLDEIRLLGLLGYGPRFDLCPVCAKSLEPGQDAFFSPLRGGACHPGCISPDEQSAQQLSPNTLAVIRRGLEAGPRVAERLRLGKKGVEQLRRCLSAFARHLRGAEINSLRFLEQMGLWSSSR